MKENLAHENKQRYRHQEERTDRHGPVGDQLDQALRAVHENEDTNRVGEQKRDKDRHAKRQRHQRKGQQQQTRFVPRH